MNELDKFALLLLQYIFTDKISSLKILYMHILFSDYSPSFTSFSYLFPTPSSS